MRKWQSARYPGYALKDEAVLDAYVKVRDTIASSITVEQALSAHKLVQAFAKQFAEDIKRNLSLWELQQLLRKQSAKKLLLFGYVLH